MATVVLSAALGMARRSPDWESEGAASLMSLLAKRDPDVDVATQINKRFQTSPKDFSEAVVVHQWDGWEPTAEPWAMCTEERTDDPICSAPSNKPRHERVSGSVIHKGMKVCSPVKATPLGGRA